MHNSLAVEEQLVTLEGTEREVVSVLLSGAVVRPVLLNRGL